MDSDWSDSDDGDSDALVIDELELAQAMGQLDQRATIREFCGIFSSVANERPESEKKKRRTIADRQLDVLDTLDFDSCCEDKKESMSKLLSITMNCDDEEDYREKELEIPNRKLRKNEIELLHKIDKDLEGYSVKIKELKNIAEKLTNDCEDIEKKRNESAKSIVGYDEKKREMSEVQLRRGCDVEMQGQERRSYLRRFAIPYFRMEHSFSVPTNQEALEMRRKRHKYVFEIPGRRHRYIEKVDDLKQVVLSNLKCQMRTKLSKDDIALDEKLKRAKIRKERNDLQLQKGYIRKKLKLVEDTKDVLEAIKWPVQPNFDKITMFQMSRRVDADRDNYMERFWKLEAFPTLNRSAFSKEETDRLMVVAKKHNYHNWEKIAVELNTGRNGYTIFPYFIKLHNRANHVPWTKEEDQRLMKLMHHVPKFGKGIRNLLFLQMICHRFPSRTYSQVYSRFFYVLNPSLQKGRFTKEESQKVMELHDQGKSFAEISHIMTNRSSIQIREHFQRMQTADRETIPWRKKEIIQLKKLVKKYGTSDWSRVSSELGTRNRSQCRLKYRALQTIHPPTVRSGPWSEEETRRLLELYDIHGNKWSLISRELGTRIASRCFMKYRQLTRERKKAGRPKNLEKKPPKKRLRKRKQSRKHQEATTEIKCTEESKSKPDRKIKISVEQLTKSSDNTENRAGSESNKSVPNLRRNPKRNTSF